MMVTAGNRRKVQVRKVREGGFTEEKRQIVLDHLAACCNVTRAAAAAEVSVETVNYHRRRDPVFAQQCAEAIDVGYDMLESASLERAANGGRYVPGGTDVPGPETVDTQLALHLLSLRRRAAGQRTGRAGYAPKRASEKELNEAILAQLDVLARRLRKQRGKGEGVLRPRPAPGQARSGRTEGVLRDGSSTGSVPPQDERSVGGPSTGSAPPQDERVLRDGSSTGSAPPQDERS
jgi:hypothetical protein